MVHSSYIQNLDILIIDAHRPSSETVREVLVELGFDPMVVARGRHALGLLESHNFDMFFIDLDLPDIPGLELIHKIRAINAESIILVESNLKDPDIVIGTMKAGVFDYIIKPVENVALEQIIKKALEFRFLRVQKKTRESQVRTRLRGQLEWLSYKETRRHLGQEGFRKVAIGNLRTVFSQGSGIGASVTLIELMSSLLQSRDDSMYRIDQEVLDLLFENNRATRNLLQGLILIEQIALNKPVLEKTTVRKFWEYCQDKWKPLLKFAGERSINIRFPPEILDADFYADQHELFLAFEELLLNACKYSSAGSEIQTHIGGGGEKWIRFTILNKPEKDPGDKNIQNLYLESFYRDHSPVEGAGDVEKFGLGLGLAVVNQIIRYNHGGNLSIQSVRDFSETEVSNSIMTEVRIPVSVSK